jgi:ParB family chromosome partitioning protein
VPEYKLIPIEQLNPPEMPARFEMEEAALISLADSIRANGILQPLIVVEVPGATAATGIDAGEELEQVRTSPSPAYEVVAGHRRFIAAGMVGLKLVDCMVHKDKEIALHAARLAENIERQELTPAEEAAYYDDLIKKYDYTEDQLIQTVRQSREYVYARLDLFNGNPDVFEALRKREINMAVAKALNRVKDVNQCHYFLSLAVQGGATARTVHAWVANYLASPAANAPAGDSPAPAPVQPVIVSDERVCGLCRNDNNQVGMVVVWMHALCKARLDESVEASAVVPGSE